VDAITRSIVEFAVQLEPTALPVAVVHDCKRRIIDTIGCTIAGFDSEPAKIARVYAMRIFDQAGATIIGTAHRSLPELAAFANSLASRYIEGNDTYPGGGGHPSDCLLPILGVAEATQANSQTAIAAIALAYEVHAFLFRAFPMRPHSLDYVVYTAAASAGGTAKVLGLSAEQTANAISLSVVPNMALDISRRGHLSMWKGAAAPNAARNGVAAAFMAASGMTGPATPFEGGLTAVVGSPIIPSFPLDPSTFAILDADFKYYLSEYHSQSPIFAAKELHSQVAIDEIESVEVFTYHFAWMEIGSGVEKWRPATRETADHSLPYIVACVLIDGDYSDAIYVSERYNDPRTLGLMRKISVTQDPEIERRYPTSLPCRIEITTKNGDRRIASVPNPIGHHHRPMSDSQIAEKFLGLVSRKIPRVRARLVLDRLWELDTSGEFSWMYRELITASPS
jgi:2-methylcitrate dehydratase